MNHYETLGVTPDATADEIKAAYRRASSENHPDKGGDHEKMQAINAAYEVLGDEERRRRYDETGDDSAPKSIDKQAEDMIRALFGEAIDKDVDPVRYATVQIADKRSTLIASRGAAEVKLTKLERRMGKTRRKRPGKNLVDAIVADRITATKRLLSAMTEAAEIIDAALLVLDADYEIEAADPFAGMSDLQRKQQGHAIAQLTNSQP